MSVEIERQDGHWHIRLGPVERWIVVVCASLLGFAAWSGWNGIVTRQDKQADALSMQAQQLAVMSAQMLALNASMADVPSLTRQVAELQVQVKRNTTDIEEVRRLRGVK